MDGLLSIQQPNTLLETQQPSGLLDLNPIDALVQKYGIRDPYKGEIDFFKKRPEVAGMATEDLKIILNPFSKNSEEEQNAVAKNEALRLFMRENNIVPDFSLTKNQKSVFQNTEYGKNEDALRQSIISRYLTGDPSVGDVTQEQKSYAQQILKMLERK